MMFTKKHNFVKPGLTLAALALLAAACPAQAQYNNGLNPFFLSSPRMLTPLGGGVVFNNFDNGSDGMTGMSFGNPVANGFNNNAFTATTFSSTTSPTFGRVGTNNSLPNGFQLPSTTVNPLTGSIRTIDQSLFFQTNPGLNPFVANGSVTQAAVNNRFNNQPQMIFRAAPLFNPTMPNPPASMYAPAAMAASSQDTVRHQFPWNQSPPQTYPSRLYIQSQNGMVNSSQQTAMANGGQVRNNQFVWQQNAPTTYPSRLYIQGQNDAGATGTVRNNQFVWQQNAPTTYPSRLFIQGQNSWMGNGSMVVGSIGNGFAGRRGFPAPVIGGPFIPFGSGVGSGPIFAGPRGGFPAPVIGGPKIPFGSPMSGTVVMGGRAR